MESTGWRTRAAWLASTSDFFRRKDHRRRSRCGQRELISGRQALRYFWRRRGTHRDGRFNAVYSMSAIGP